MLVIELLPVQLKIQPGIKMASGCQQLTPGLQKPLRGFCYPRMLRTRSLKKLPEGKRFLCYYGQLKKQKKPSKPLI